MADLKELVAELKEPEALAYVDQQLEAGVEALSLLNDARAGMKTVGERFAEGTYFIPDLTFSGQIIRQIAEKLKPHLLTDDKGTDKLGTVVIGTVEGDIHDIGKDMVVFLLDTAGFEVIDLGIDVPVPKFAEAIKESGAKVVGLSGFLTLAFESMKKTVESITEAGLRDEVKIMIGGGQIDEDVRAYTGADAYGNDAQAAVTMTQDWLGV